MKPNCPKCNAEFSRISKNGFFYRRSDSKRLQKFFCNSCKSSFSLATFSPAYRQNKRKLNSSLQALLCSSVSQRRSAKILNINRKTVARKLIFLSEQARLKHKAWLKTQKKFKRIQFDDLETFEHTKLKPLSLSMAVEDRTRKIIGFRLSQIGAKGLLVEKSKKRYGKRKNTSFKKRRELFKELKAYLEEEAVFSTDEHKDYPRLVRNFFPKAKHKTHKSAKGSLVGQGELKRVSFDPLFSINRTFAMLRANVNRLVRRTWCTTKKAKFLEMHLWLYVDYHNLKLLNSG